MPSLKLKSSNSFKFTKHLSCAPRCTAAHFSVKRSKQCRGVTQKIVGRLLTLEGWKLSQVFTPLIGLSDRLWVPDPEVQKTRSTVTRRLPFSAFFSGMRQNG